MEKKKMATGVSASLLAYAITNAVLQSFILVDDLNENKRFEYVSIDTTYEATGNVDYETASKWLLIEYRKNGANSLRIVDKDGMDVLNQEHVANIHKIEDSYISIDENVLSIEALSNYLVDDLLKELYSSEDIESIIAIISANYDWHQDKEIKILTR